MPRKKKHIVAEFESLNNGNKFLDDNGNLVAETSANIYESVLMSRAFKSLKTRQKLLYVYCKAQYYGKRKPGKDYKDVEEFQSNEMFYFNWATVQRYNLYSDTMKKEFYSDMKALGERGFIKTVAKGGGNGRTKSIYKFDTLWKKWDR